jgi:hypothetical protein
MSKQWAQKKSGSNSSLPVQKSSSSQRPFTAPVYDAPAPKQTPSVQAKRRNVDWNRVTVEAQSPAGVQAKLSVGAPGDKYEQEADATANKVMTMPAPEKEKPVQREMASEEKEEEVQTKPLADGIQREMAPEEKEEEVQTKLATEGKSQAGSNLESQLSGTKGGGSALSDEVRSHMEPRFGANFSSVRVHTDSAAVQMNRDLGAQAFTHGSDIYFGAGKSAGKDELTAHELTHVVQQGGTSTSSVQRVEIDSSKVEIDSSKIEAERISETIKNITGKNDVKIEFEVLEAKDLLKKYLHTNAGFPDYDEDQDYDTYKEFAPVAFCEHQTGKIYMNKAEFASESDINYDKLNAVLVHEAHHSASFNHTGLQKSEITEDTLLDEATTDYFAIIAYIKMYPEKNYMDFTNYYKDAQDKKAEEWQGNALTEMIEDGIFTKEDLANAYYKGDNKSIEKMKKNTQKIDQILSKYKKK